MALTDTAIKNSKAREKTYKLYDERGLYLEISPSGGKWWRFKFRFEDKEKRLSLGTSSINQYFEARHCFGTTPSRS